MPELDRSLLVLAAFALLVASPARAATQDPDEPGSINAVVHVLANDEGRVIDVDVHTKADPALAERLRAAVLELKLRPARKDGHAVAARAWLRLRAEPVRGHDATAPLEISVTLEPVTRANPPPPY